MQINPTLRSIIVDSGLANIEKIDPVSGGDINQSYCLRGKEEKYFLKVNEADRYPMMFEWEAKSLTALMGLKECVVPNVIRHSTLDSRQYLILSWISKGQPKLDFWERFGMALAELHKRHNDNFGWAGDNFIGSLPQQNNWKPRWSDFYAHNRIMPLTQQLFDQHGIESKNVKAAEKLCGKLDQIFPKEKPSLLHGDLWSGNFMVAEDGNPCVYDPAVYYGHREMDLGMTKLFGGFDMRFYEAYHETFPLEKNWKSRMELTQLYPLLVHAILFGGGYVQQVASIIKRFGS